MKKIFLLLALVPALAFAGFTNPPGNAGGAIVATSVTASGNITANNYVVGSQTVVASATTITLTVASPLLTSITGTATQLVVLPNATTLAVSTSYQIDNNGTSASNDCAV